MAVRPLTDNQETFGIRLRRGNREGETERQQRRKDQGQCALSMNWSAGLLPGSLKHRRLAPSWSWALRARFMAAQRAKQFRASTPPTNSTLGLHGQWMRKDLAVWSRDSSIVLSHAQPCSPG